jgi:integrase
MQVMTLGWMRGRCSPGWRFSASADTRVRGQRPHGRVTRPGHQRRRPGAKLGIAGQGAVPENNDSQDYVLGITPENAASAVVKPGELTPENTKLLAGYADHLEHARLSGHTPQTYLGAVRAYLAWLEQAETDGDLPNDAAAKDWAVHDYRSYLVTVDKRATATVNKHLAALEDFYVWRGLGPAAGRQAPPGAAHAPKALEPRVKLRYLRAVEAWPGACDRALALLLLYAGTRIAEIRVLDVADVRLSARKGDLRAHWDHRAGSVPAHGQ